VAGHHRPHPHRMRTLWEPPARPFRPSATQEPLAGPLRPPAPLEPPASPLPPSAAPPHRLQDLLLLRLAGQTMGRSRPQVNASCRCQEAEVPCK
jgi:hypothetical protein